MSILILFVCVEKNNNQFSFFLQFFALHFFALFSSFPAWIYSLDDFHSLAALRNIYDRIEQGMRAYGRY